MKGPGFKLRPITAHVTEALASAGLLGDMTQRDTRDRAPGGGGSTVLGSWCWGRVGDLLPSLTQSQLLGHCLLGVRLTFTPGSRICPWNCPLHLELSELAGSHPDAAWTPGERAPLAAPCLVRL